MKVIHLVLGKANPNRMNGVNKVVHQLSQSQKEIGCDAEIWGITPTPEDRSEIPERSVATKLFKANKHKLWIDNQIENELKNIEGRKIMHLHGGFIPEYFHLYRLLKKLDIPYVVTPHGCYNLKSMENGKAKKDFYFSFFEKKLVSGSKALHCLGKSEQEAVDRLVPTARKVIIPNGQNLDDLAFNEENIKQETVPVFGFCGRMDRKMKGLDLLLNGFAKYLKNENNAGKLWLIGGAFQFEELQQMATNLGLKDNAVFFGPKFGDEKFNLLANCTAFYHPSRYEGLPMSILEAAGLGIPCVVSDATNMAQYITKNDAGIFLENNTAERIAKSMETVQHWYKNNNIWKQKSDAAKTMVANVFNWNTIAKQFAELYAA